MGFFHTKLFNKTLSIEDLSYISELLQTNVSLHDALQLVKNKKNEYIFNSIIKELSKGRMIEEIIEPYLPKQIKSYIIPLLKNMPFLSSLSLSLDFNNKHNENGNKLYSAIAYPCILLFISITVLYLFDIYGMDSIFDLLKTFNTDLFMYQNIRIIFRVIINIIYYGILVIILVLIYFLQKNRICILYSFFSKYYPNSLINTYYSEEFVSLLLICIEKGYKTKEALTILKSMKTKPVISFLAFHMDESLLEGETLKEASNKNYYDLSLSRFIKIANYTNEFSKMLNSYTNLARQRILNKMKKYTLTIQIATYSFIGVIVILIYQILFIPMQALSSY